MVADRGTVAGWLDHEGRGCQPSTVRKMLALFRLTDFRVICKQSPLPVPPHLLAFAFPSPRIKPP